VLGKAPGLHAEITAMQAAAENGLTPEAIGSSWNICPACQAALKEAGAEITGPRTAVLAKIGRMFRYDEVQLVQALSAETRAAQAAFAAASAERLQPLYTWFHDVSGQGDPATLRAALDARSRSAGGTDLRRLDRGGIKPVRGAGLILDPWMTSDICRP